MDSTISSLVIWSPFSLPQPCAILVKDSRVVELSVSTSCGGQDAPLSSACSRVPGPKPWFRYAIHKACSGYFDAWTRPRGLFKVGRNSTGNPRQSLHLTRNGQEMIKEELCLKWYLIHCAQLAQESQKVSYSISWADANEFVRLKLATHNLISRLYFTEYTT